MIPFFLFITFSEPGILFPWLAPYRVQFTMGMLAAIVGVMLGKFHYEKKRMHVFVLLFYIAQILSVYYSGLYQMALEAFNWFPFVSAYFLIVLSVNDEKKLKNCIWGILIGSAVVILYGISRLWWDPVVAQNRWITGAYGMYENQNDYSYIIIFSYPFWLWFVFHYRNILIDILCMIITFACIIGIIFSLSRGGALAFVLENLLFFWFYIKKPSIRYVLIPVMLLLSYFVITVVWENREAVQLGTYSYADSKDSRSDLWRSGKNMFLSNPIFGVGSRRFSEYTKQYMPSWASYPEIMGKNAHNTYIEVLATSGLLGFLPFIYCVYLSIRMIYKRYKNYEGNPRDNLSLPILVATLSYFFRAIFNAKSFTPEIFVVMAICLVLSDSHNQTPVLAGLSGKDHIQKGK